MKCLIPLLHLALVLMSGSTAFAAKEVFERTKPHVNIGTIGHIDHGKTALTLSLAFAAEMPLETVFLQSEDSAGSESGDLQALVAQVETSRALYRVHDFDDEDTVANLISGAVAQDGAILVVSASDGPMPQTKEHILLARQSGVPAIVVFLNLDGVYEPECIDRTEIELKRLLQAAGYDKGAPVVRGSIEDALRGEAMGLAALAALMDEVDDAILGR
jgi:elongation factor Tu